MAKKWLTGPELLRQTRTRGEVFVEAFESGLLREFARLTETGEPEFDARLVPFTAWARQIDELRRKGVLTCDEAAKLLTARAHDMLHPEREPALTLTWAGPEQRSAPASSNQQPSIHQE